MVTKIHKVGFHLATYRAGVAGSAIHGHTLNRQNNRKAPATPPQQEQAESDQDGHPDRVKTKGRQQSRRKDGGWNKCINNRR